MRSPACSNHEERECVMLISLFPDGETVALCGECVPGFLAGIANAFGLELPEPKFTDDEDTEPSEPMAVPADAAGTRVVPNRPRKPAGRGRHVSSAHNGAASERSPDDAETPTPEPAHQ